MRPQPRVSVPHGRATPGWLFPRVPGMQQHSWIWEPGLLLSPRPSPSLSIPRFGFYKYMKMDEEEEDPRQRAFLFLGPDSESPVSLGMGPSSCHPCWQLNPSEASGGLGCAELRPSEQLFKLGVTTGRCGKQDIGLGFALPPAFPGLASAMGSRNRTQCGVWGCPWSLGMFLASQRLFRACPGQFAAWQSPGQVGFAPGWSGIGVGI